MKMILLQRFIMVNVCIFSLRMPSTFFHCYNPGYFIADSMQIPRRLSILGCEWKPEAVARASQDR